MKTDVSIVYWTSNWEGEVLKLDCHTVLNLRYVSILSEGLAAAFDPLRLSPSMHSSPPLDASIVRDSASMKVNDRKRKDASHQRETHTLRTFPRHTTGRHSLLIWP